LKNEEALGIPLVRGVSLQLFSNLFNVSFSNGTGRHIMSMRREGD
jgi:hypothetical protein